MSQRSIGSSTTSEGVRWGVILAVLLIIGALIGRFVGSPLTGFYSIFTLLAAVALYFVAGFQASKATGRAGSGTLAGLLTGAVSALLNGIVVVALYIQNSGYYRRIAQVQANAVRYAHRYTNREIVRTELFAAVVLIIVALAIGALVGWLGGLVGRSRAAPPQTPYQEAMYQGIPANSYGVPSGPSRPGEQVPSAPPPPTPEQSTWSPPPPQA